LSLQYEVHLIKDIRAIKSQDFQGTYRSIKMKVYFQTFSLYSIKFDQQYAICTPPVLSGLFMCGFTYQNKIFSPHISPG